ncbi:DUF6412 domain-containing protein [Nocardia alni]|uniref:DUF6412 domain-containing protein n=1 Tax=Nocardia alni TaxID=2815723 RepID=UPI001C23C124|nr:DUF6412 domain-containing protein [Nocardia alni]
MVMRSAPMVCAFVVSLWAMVLMPEQAGSLLAVGTAVMLGLAVATAHSAQVRVLPVAVQPGPPVSAQRRRRGSFLRQSNPDTAGRARPRAPGCGG